MTDTDPFDELVTRVKDLTGLSGRAASAVAADFEDGQVPSAAQIVERAQELGYEVADKPLLADGHEPEIAPEICMDPATVIAEVYENSPRVLMAHFPAIGRAPSELQANAEVMAELDQLPDEIRALLVKVDLVDEKITVWLRDEANDVDRPIGPIDISRYRTGQQLHEAIGVLLSRLPRVLRADTN